MSYETIIFEKQQKVAVIKLNRPQNMNALEAKLIEELLDAIQKVSEDREIGSVVLTGTGKAFSAGGDLFRLLEGFSLNDGIRFIQDSHPWVLKFLNLEKPVIAAVNGYAVGAGFCIALLCDLVYAAENAKFGQAFIKVGLVPDLACTFLLPRLVGLPKAKELVFRGHNIDAAEAYRIGLVNGVFPADRLLPETEKLAQELASGPPVALSLAKKMLNLSVTNYDLNSLLEMEAYAQGVCFQTEDHKEAIHAFLEKREPVFKGR